MKIASFGSKAQGDELHNVEFFSARTIWDFDAAVYDLEFVIRVWLNGQPQPAADVILLGSVIELVRVVQRRSEEMWEFIKAGHPVVLFPSILPSLRFVDEDGETQPIPDLARFFPACGSAATPGTGLKIEVKGMAPIAKFGKRLDGHFMYGATLSKWPGEACFYVPKINKVVGSFLCDAKQWLLVCPRLSTNAGWTDFLDAFKELHDATRPNRSVAAALPQWHATYLLPGEAEIHEQIIESETLLKRAEESLAKKRAAQESLEFMKRLFTDKGDSLRDAAKMALEGLGFAVTLGPEGRDDLIAKCGNRVAVIEVKGKDSKSAAEADAAQLEKWVSEYFGKYEVMPKGILIVNGFREKPLVARTQEVFPDQMLTYSRNRNHCLISGLQLLCLYLDSKTNDSRKKAIDELFKTVGGFPRFRDTSWQSVITASKG